MPIYKTGKQKDGKAQYRVIVNYTDINGEYKKASRCVYGAAEAKLAELELQKRPADATKSITFSELVEIYQNARKSEVRESTYEKSRRIIQSEIEPFLGRTRLSYLTVPILQDWKNQITEKGRSNSYNRRIYAELHALLNFAVRMDYIEKNPLVKIGNFKDPNTFPETGSQKIQYYTPEQFKLFIAQAKPEKNDIQNWKCYVFFNIAFYTGARKGEINALRWSDIDGDVMHIRRSISQKIKGKSIVETPPKNGSSVRDIKLPRQLLEILNEYKEIQKAVPQFTDDFRVCGGAKTVSDTLIENKNREYAEKAGLPHIRIHDFRHSHASLLINKGLIIQEVSRRLGHSNVQITWNTYSHLYPHQESHAIEILESL